MCARWAASVMVSDAVVRASARIRFGFACLMLAASDEKGQNVTSHRLLQIKTAGQPILRPVSRSARPQTSGASSS